MSKERKILDEKELARREKLRKQMKKTAERCRGMQEYTRRCPFCNSALFNIYQGNYGYCKIKCPRCEETVILTPFLSDIHM